MIWIIALNIRDIIYYGYFQFSFWIHKFREIQLSFCSLKKRLGESYADHGN